MNLGPPDYEWATHGVGFSKRDAGHKKGAARRCDQGGAGGEGVFGWAVATCLHTLHIVFPSRAMSR